MNNLMMMRDNFKQAEAAYKSAKEDAFARLFERDMIPGRAYTAADIEREFGIPIRTFTAKLLHCNWRRSLSGRVRVFGVTSRGDHYSAHIHCNPRWLKQEFIATDGSGRKVKLTQKIYEYTLDTPQPPTDYPIRPNY